MEDSRYSVMVDTETSSFQVFLSQHFILTYRAKKFNRNCERLHMLGSFQSRKPFDIHSVFLYKKTGGKTGGEGGGRREESPGSTGQG